MLHPGRWKTQLLGAMKDKIVCLREVRGQGVKPVSTLSNLAEARILLTR